MIKIEQNPKLGYYTVGSEKFFSKPLALTRATETNQFPEWNFSNEIFGAQDWTITPAINIRELYRIRAQQLRDQYDYIRLEFSGGGDSNFFRNNFTSICYSRSTLIFWNNSNSNNS